MLTIETKIPCPVCSMADCEDWQCNIRNVLEEQTQSIAGVLPWRVRLWDVDNTPSEPATATNEIVAGFLHLAHAELFIKALDGNYDGVAIELQGEKL